MQTKNTSADNSAISPVVPAQAAPVNAAENSESADALEIQIDEIIPPEADKPRHETKNLPAVEIPATNGSSAATTPEEQKINPAPAAKIESGLVALDRLHPHPKNGAIYGEETVADLIDSIKKFGVQDPVLVTPDGIIISGHRRVRAAKEVGLTEVLVRVFAATDEFEILVALLEHNRHRVKSKKQLAREFELQLQIDKELAKRRQATKSKDNGQQVVKLPPAAKSKARDAAAKKVGISGRSGENGVKVLHVIEKLKTEGKEDEAQELENKLETSIHGAHQLAIDKGHIERRKPEKSHVEPEAPAPKQAAQETPQTHPKELDSDAAIELADKILEFLRGKAARPLSASDKRNWGAVFAQLETCRVALGITLLKSAK